MAETFAFNQIMGDNGIANYNVDWDDMPKYSKLQRYIHYESSIGFSLKNNLLSGKPNTFILNFWHPYKQKFNHKNIDNCELLLKEQNLEAMILRFVGTYKVPQ